MKKPPTLAGLELGPRQFILAAGQLDEGKRLTVQAVESIPARGFEREGLSDPVECADAISRVVRQAERNLTARLSSAVVAFSGSQFKCLNSSASIPIPDPGSGISRQDVERAVSTCRTLSLDYDRQIVHSFERGFAVDGQPGVKNPVGLSGKKLTVDLHLVTAPSLGVQNLTRVVNRAGLEVERILLPGLGAAEAVLTEIDRDLGVTFVRVGDYQTEVILFDNGEPKETFLIPGGWDELAENLSRSLKLPRVSAEHLLDQVSTVEDLPEEKAGLPMRAGPGAAVRSFPQGQVVSVVRARAKELLGRIQRRVAANPVFLDCASGVVMVGHLCRLDGFLEMAEGHFNMPVRLGAVREIGLAAGITLRNSDTTAVGLLQHACRLRNGGPPGSDRPFFFRPLETVQRLLQDYF